MKALLVTIGSLGDLHPFIAIGQALAVRGVAVTLAVPADHVDKVRGAGLSAAAILPSFAVICAQLGIDEGEAARHVVTRRSFVLDAVILPSLAESTAALDALADDADVIVASLFALAGGIVAEKRRLPLVAINLQPMAMPSAYDPPLTPEGRLAISAPTGAMARRWNRALLYGARAAIRWRYAGAVDRVRQAHGLPAARLTPIFDPVPAQSAVLCCYSPALATVQADAPPGAEAIGFPQFDSADGRAPKLDPALAAFLDHGPPPIVFTLGSFLVHAPGHFYAQAAAVAAAIGYRAVLLTGTRDAPHAEKEVFTIGYAPHSQLFPRAAAVVHHGGIGTTGQAMRAGVPQLVVPFFGDQFDNGGRISRLGIGLCMRPTRFVGTGAIAIMGALLADSTIAKRAREIAALVRSETAAETAADRIMSIAISRPSPP